MSYLLMMCMLLPVQGHSCDYISITMAAGDAVGCVWDRGDQAELRDCDKIIQNGLDVACIQEDEIHEFYQINKS